MDGELKIVYRKTVDLIPYERNTRTHTEEQIGKVADSIREFGFTNPILIDGENGIIAGHCRLVASKQLGMVEVPTIELAHLSEAQRRAYVIADNKLAEEAGWDEELLRLELGALAEMDFDTTLTGFSEKEMAAIVRAAERVKGLTDENDVPEIEEIPVSRMGDVWLLGAHQLMCGDATSREDVALLLGTVKPHLMVTDPPYGVSYEPEWRDGVARADGSKIGVRATGKVKNDDRADWREAWALFPGDVAYVWHAGVHAITVAESLTASSFEIRTQIIWAKPHFAISRGNYHWQHEPCWYAVRKGRTGHWSGDRKQSTLWSIEHNKNDTGHGTQKPVEAMRRPMENNASPGQAIYEPFSGSGTSLIAAETCGRVCLALEIDPLYVDMAIRRWEAFAGDKARLEGTDSTFEGIAEKRCG